MFLVKAGGIIYTDGTKMGRTASLLEDITTVRISSWQNDRTPEDRVQFSNAKF